MALAEKVSTDLIKQELEIIRQKTGGILYPKDVVGYAEDESTSLHSQFEWDNTEAAHQHRLWQARQLIRTVIAVLPNKTEPVQIYVSLKTDRREEGGYRYIVDVLSDEEKRTQMLSDALEALQYWERKYQELTELKPIFEAAQKVRSKV